MQEHRASTLCLVPDVPCSGSGADGIAILTDGGPTDAQNSSLIKLHYGKSGQIHAFLSSVSESLFISFYQDFGKIIRWDLHPRAFLLLPSGCKRMAFCMPVLEETHSPCRQLGSADTQTIPEVYIDTWRSAVPAGPAG